MASKHPDTQSRTLAGTLGDEYRCLKNALNPLMADDDTVRTVEKVVALVLVTAWTAGTLAMTFDAIQTTIPPHWLPFTAIVFLLVGRLWNIEVEKYLPGGGGNSNSE